ncbi:MAG: hypothetical protein JSU73_12740 [candidate division WOR-3 bacterium]|nr:MAG: hypothetical protein JSU73_12740 [candidate division WOR-3 bacterium]
MRRLLIVLGLTAVLLVPYSCRKWNKAPEVPADPFPADSATGVDTAGLVLRWTGKDPDGDVLKHYVHFGDSISLAFLDSTAAETLAVGELLPGTQYSWQVISEDRYWDSTASPVWTFTTAVESIPNHPPYVPSNRHPRDSAQHRETTLTLYWSGGDPDSGDTVLYDVYADTAYPPRLRQGDIADTSVQLVGLAGLTQHWWKVVAQDKAGDSAVGPVWTFTTAHAGFVNSPPNVPSNPDPADGAAGIDTAVTLSWTGGDPDTWDIVLYDIHFGTGPMPPLLRSGFDSTSFDISGLEHNTQYYWKVVARDDHNDSAVGEVWDFTTESLGDTNRPPYVPSDPSPDSGATGRSRFTVLSWTGGDPDSGDTVTYDVHFGTATPPPLVQADHPDNSFAPGTLAAETDYYWQIVARDRDSAETPGPVWLFTTGIGVEFIEPAVGTRWRVGADTAIKWTGDTAFGPTRAGRAKTKSRWITPAGIPASDSIVVYYTPDGENWTREGAASEPGRFAWIVPEPPTTLAQVRLLVHDGPDTSVVTSDRFEVYDTLPPSPIMITSPAGGESWVAGDTHDIIWIGGTFGVDSSVVWYSSDNGSNWVRQGRSMTPGWYSWVVPGPETDEARIQVRAFNLSDSSVGTSEAFSVTVSFPDTVVAVVNVGQGPRGLAWNSINDRVYVANSGSNSVTVIDGLTNGVLTTVDVGEAPARVFWHPERNKAYVVDSARGCVYVIDGQSNVVEDSVGVGTMPRAVCWNRVDDKLYVANFLDNSVSVIDLAQAAVVAIVTTGGRPQALCWNPAANKVYAACFQTDQISIIDGAGDSLLANLTVGFGPSAVVADSAANRVYAAVQNSSLVSLIDGETNSTLANVAVGTGPCAIAWSVGSGKAYTANLYTGNVSVISDTAVVATITAGQSPRALVWASGIDMIYAAGSGSGDLHIINGPTNEKLGRLAVGSQPTALCWNGTDTKVYVVNEGDGTVSIIGTRR